VRTHDRTPTSPCVLEHVLVHVLVQELVQVLLRVPNASSRMGSGYRTSGTLIETLIGRDIGYTIAWEFEGWLPSFFAFLRFVFLTCLAKRTAESPHYRAQLFKEVTEVLAVKAICRGVEDAKGLSYLLGNIYNQIM
jgi:hypothetical protein